MGTGVNVSLKSNIMEILDIYTVVYIVGQILPLP